VLNLNVYLTCLTRLDMKLEKPPLIQDFDPEMFDVIWKGTAKGFLKITDDRYLYWDEVKNRKDLPLEPNKSWALIKAHRRLNYKALILGTEKFNYCITSGIQEELHEFDLKLIGGLYKNPITQFDRVEYLRNSLMEEAIASSQIEGAATTTKVAWEMLKSGRAPRNESEQMIFNNLRAINFIQDKTDEKLNKSFVIELHRIMTANTSAEYCAGDYRDDEIFVQDFVDGEIAHVPPGWKNLESLMDHLYEFANSDEFIHPIVKAAIIHFLIGYIHPFKDGNGRTARALFYWILTKKGYTLIKNISISRAILESRVQYDKAFLKSEYDGNDMTYFITYTIRSLHVAFNKLVAYRDQKKQERDLALSVKDALINFGLTERQADLMGYLFIKKDVAISLQYYVERYSVVRQTARKDLAHLVKLGLLRETKEGKQVIFRMASKDAVENFMNSK